MTRSQVSRARQQGCGEPLLGGDSPPLRKRAPSNEGDSQAQGSTISDRVSKTGAPLCKTPSKLLPSQKPPVQATLCC